MTQKYVPLPEAEKAVRNVFYVDEGRAFSYLDTFKARDHLTENTVEGILLTPDTLAAIEALRPDMEQIMSGEAQLALGSECYMLNKVLAIIKGEAK